jgi:hypothetical protein
MEVQSRVQPHCYAQSTSSTRHFFHRATHFVGQKLAIPLYVSATLFTALGGFLWGYDTGRRVILMLLL